MKTQVKALVVGGGAVGTSIAYHLAKAGWSDVMLLERSELTSGSTWHAAGGFHTLNGDTNMAALQGYTIRLYRELEEITGAAPAASVAAPAAAPAPAPAAAPAGGEKVCAPMPGNILDVKVKAGASVKAGDVLVILEAMKMENEIVAPQDGTVASINVNKGDTVNSGDVLVSMN